MEKSCSCANSNSVFGCVFQYLVKLDYICTHSNMIYFFSFGVIKLRSSFVASSIVCEEVSMMISGFLGAS